MTRDPFGEFLIYAKLGIGNSVYTFKTFGLEFLSTVSIVKLLQDWIKWHFLKSSVKILFSMQGSISSVTSSSALVKWRSTVGLWNVCENSRWDVFQTNYDRKWTWCISDLQNQVVLWGVYFNQHSSIPYLPHVVTSFIVKVKHIEVEHPVVDKIRLYS